MTVIGDAVINVRLDKSAYERGVRGLDGKSRSTFGRIGRAAKAAFLPSMVAVGVGVAAVGAKAVTLEADFSKTMRQVAAATGAPKKEIGSLSKLALQLGRDTVFSASDASQAMLELAKGGLSPATIKAGALRSSLQLAAAGGLELGDAANTMVRAMGAFNLNGKQAGQVANALAGAANASSADVGDLSLALAQSGLSAHAAGFNIQETTAVLAAFANQGLRGSDAGTSLKVMLQRLQPASAKQAEAFRELGLITADGRNKLVKANGEFKSAAQIAGILHRSTQGLTKAEKVRNLGLAFGTDAMRAALAMSNEGAKGIKKYEKATSDQTAAQRMASAAMKGTSGAIEKFKGSLETFLLKVGIAMRPLVIKVLNLAGAFLDHLFPALRKLGGVLAAVGRFIRRNKELFIGLATAIGVAFAASRAYNAFLAVQAAGGLLKYAKSVSVISKLTVAWSKAQWLLNIALKGNPIGIVITALAALATGIYLAYKNSATFRRIVKGAFEAVKTAAVALKNFFAGPFVDFFTGLGSKITGAFKAVKRFFTVTLPGWFHKPIEWLKDHWVDVLVTVLGGPFGLAIKKIVEHWDTIKEKVRGAARWVIQKLKDIFGPLGGWFRDVWGRIKDATSKAWDAVKNTIRDTARAIWDKIKKFFTQTIPDGIKKGWGYVKDSFRRAWQFYKDLVKDASKAIWDKIKKFFTQTIPDGIKRGWNAVKDLFRNAWDRFKSIVKDAAGAIWDRIKQTFTKTIPQGFRDGVNKIKDIWERIKDIMSGPVNWVIDHVINKLIDAINWVSSKLGFGKVLGHVGHVGGGGASGSGVGTGSRHTGNANQSPGRGVRRAGGGVIPGWTPGRDVHHYRSATGPDLHLSGGESVMVPEWTRAVGGPRAVDRMNRDARRGRFREGIHRRRGGVVHIDGEPLTFVSAKQLRLAEHLSRTNMRVMQGSYQAPSSYSGTSHTGGGVMDTSPGNFRMQYFLRRVGFAAWARNIPGAHRAGSGAHVHSVSRIDPTARGNAQVAAFLHGGDGLGGRDYGPRPPLLPHLLKRLGGAQLRIAGGAFGGGMSIGDLVSSVFHGIKGFLGGLFGKVTDTLGGAARAVWDFAKDKVGLVLNAVPGGAVGAAFARGALGALGKLALDKVKDLLGIGAAQSGGLNAGKGVHGSLQKIVNAVAKTFGWGSGRQWAAIKSIVESEGGWDPTAQNPKSTAYGMFQFLDGTWAGTGIHKTSNPRLQAIAAMRYIRSRYGGPLRAWAFHRRHNSYDQGGMLTGIGSYFKGTNKPERVLSPRQTRAFEELVSLLRRTRGGDGQWRTALRRILQAWKRGDNRQAGHPAARAFQQLRRLLADGARRGKRTSRWEDALRAILKRWDMALPRQHRKATRDRKRIKDAVEKGNRMLAHGNVLLSRKGGQWPEAFPAGHFITPKRATRRRHPGLRDQRRRRPDDGRRRRQRNRRPRQHRRVRANRVNRAPRVRGGGGKDGGRGGAARHEFVITNWNEGKGFFRELAKREIRAEARHDASRRRQGSK